MIEENDQTIAYIFNLKPKGFIAVSSDNDVYPIIAYSFKNKLFMIALANSFGVAVLTTYMFGGSVDMIIFMSIFAVGAAVEIITGQNLGAGKIERIFAYHRSAIKQLSYLLLILAVLIFAFSSYFIGLFVSDVKLISEIEIYLRIAVFAYLPFSVGIISLRVISGSGDYFRSFRLVAFIFFAIQLPFAYLLSEYTSLAHYGIWYAILLSHIVFAVLSGFSKIAGIVETGFLSQLNITATFIEYFATGITAGFVVPWILVKMKLMEIEPVEPETS